MKATNRFLEIELSRNVQVLEYTDDHGPPIMEAADGTTFCRLKLSDTDHRYLIDHASKFPNWVKLPIPPEYSDRLPSEFKDGVPLSNSAGFFYYDKGRSYKHVGMYDTSTRILYVFHECW